MMGLLGVLLDGAGKFLHRAGRLFQRRGLRFGTAGQVGIARGDFAGPPSHRLGALLDLSDQQFDVDLQNTQ